MAACTQVGDQAGHDFSDRATFVVAGAPTTGGVGPHAALLYTIQDGLNCSIVVFTPGDLESQTVVCRVLCGEFGYTVPFGVAQIGVHDDKPVEYACDAGCVGHHVEGGLRSLTRAGVHPDDVVVGQSRGRGRCHRGGRITGCSGAAVGLLRGVEEVRTWAFGIHALSAWCAPRAGSA
jgi:hypothetical protein